MDTVGAYEAKTHFSGLLERVVRGETITITRHGVPVAVLRPFDSSKNVPSSDAIAALREFRRDKRLNGVSIRELIDEGRR